MPSNQTPNPANSYNTKKWAVLVCGPGSVLAAHDFEEAATQCAKINQMVIDCMIPRSVSPDCPTLYAQVVIWGDQCVGEHDPDSTDWNEIC